MEKSSLFDEKSDICINYEAEYKRLFMENVSLKEENETLKEAIIKLVKLAITK